MRTALLLAALLAPSMAAAQQAGDQFQLVRTTQTEQRSPGAMQSTQNSDALLERVVAVTPAGIELEYSLPPGSQGRWDFPVRVLRTPDGALKLRNRAEIEARIDTSLKDMNLTRAACASPGSSGREARLNCDPESALHVVSGFDVGPFRPAQGSPYPDPQAARPGRLQAKPNGKGFTAEMDMDPAGIRELRAQTDVMIAGMQGGKLSLDAARKAHAADKVSGTIRVTLDTDTAGETRRRTRITTQTTTRGDQTETLTVTEVIERRPIRKQVSPDSI